MALAHTLDPFDYPARYQFNNTVGGGKGANYLGSTACTDTCVQMIIEYYKEKSVSLEDIRKASGGPNDGVHGLIPSQQLRALAHYGITNYKYAVGINYQFVMDHAVKTGPVIVYVGYGAYPIAAHNKCSQGFVATVGGKTDCIFTGAHATLAIGIKRIFGKDGKVLRYDAAIRDPDHNSDSRPEKPPYDQFPQPSLGNAMKHLVSDTVWTHTACLYPVSKKKL